MRNWYFKISARLRKKTRFFGGVYIKNPANILLGKSAKILRGASLIATRGFISVGDFVHINRMVTINAEILGAEVVLESGVEINDGSLLLAGGKDSDPQGNHSRPRCKADLLPAYLHRPYQPDQETTLRQ